MNNDREIKEWLIFYRGGGILSFIHCVLNKEESLFHVLLVLEKRNVGFSCSEFISVPKILTNMLQ